MTQTTQGTVAAAAAIDQHNALGMGPSESPRFHNLHPEAQWFPRAGLGLFIHWGIASVHGKLDLSWAMMAGTPYDASEQGRNKVTPREYWQLADRFQPDDYDPERWIVAAAKAGFQYAVFTAMHHDGYTLWPSQFSGLGTHTHMGGRDLVKPFVDACRKHGLKVGLYYSPPDWYFDRHYKSFHYRSDDQQRFVGREHFGLDHEPIELPVEPPEHAQQRRVQFHGRVEELLTRYGRIDLLWFDGGAYDNDIRDRARAIQPWIVLNNRSCDGDYAHTECHLPHERFTGWFETCHCWQASDIKLPDGRGTVDVWGYRDEEKYKSVAWMIQSLVKLRAWGGNLLVNVGPGPDGSLPSVVYERFEKTAQWMNTNRQSVIDTLPGYWPEHSPVPMTISGDKLTWYLHLLPEYQSPVVLENLPLPESANMLHDGAKVEMICRDGKLILSAPDRSRSEMVDVMALHWNQPREMI